MKSVKENSKENEKCEGKQWRKWKVWEKTVKKMKSVKENCEENEKCQNYEHKWKKMKILKINNGQIITKIELHCQHKFK